MHHQPPSKPCLEAAPLAPCGVRNKKSYPRGGVFAAPRPSEDPFLFSGLHPSPFPFLSHAGENQKKARWGGGNRDLGLPPSLTGAAVSKKTENFLQFLAGRAGRAQMARALGKGLPAKTFRYALAKIKNNRANFLKCGKSFTRQARNDKSRWRGVFIGLSTMRETKAEA